MTLPLQFYYLNFNPYNPIPNGPFYSAQQDLIQGPWYPLVVGSGLTVDLATSTISATGGGGGGVTQILAGTGVTVSPVGGTGAVTVNATATTWATLGDKNNASGPTDIALGLDAGFSQGLGAIAIGALAGNVGQATAAIAIGGGSGTINQGACAVAVGQSAGISGQGVEALALGSQAGTTNQAACSIVINASGVPLENTVANTTVIKPVRNAGAAGLPAGFFQVAYNPTTGELVYYS
jgi:hypothetical protein